MIESFSGRCRSCAAPANLARSSCKCRRRFRQACTSSRSSTAVQCSANIGWPSSSGIATGHGDQLPETLGFFRARFVAFRVVDAPAKDHFTIMPSDLNEITNPGSPICGCTAVMRALTLRVRLWRLVSITITATKRSRRCEIAETARRKANEVHVVFNNNALDYAPHAAARLRVTLAKSFRPVPQTLELF